MKGLERYTQHEEITVASLQRWLVEAMVLAAASDGRLDERQTLEMSRIVASWPEFHDAATEDVAEMLQRGLQSLQADGFHVRIHAIAGALPRYAHRVLAFRAAVAIICSDGELANEEMGLLRDMQKILGVAEADVQRAFEDARVNGNPLLPADIEPVEAYLDCLLMAAAVDHHLADEEWATVVAFVLSRPELEGIDEDRLRSFIDTRLRAYSRDGIDTRLESLAEDLPYASQRETAFGLAASMVAVDGELDEREIRFLTKLRRALELDEAQSALVLDGVVGQYR